MLPCYPYVTVMAVFILVCTLIYKWGEITNVFKRLLKYILVLFEYEDHEWIWPSKPCNEIDVEVPTFLDIINETAKIETCVSLSRLDFREIKHPYALSIYFLEHAFG